MKRTIALSLIICLLLSGCGIRARVPSDEYLAENREVQTVEGSQEITAAAEDPPKEEPVEKEEEDPEEPPAEETPQEEPEEKQEEKPPVEENRELPSKEDPEAERKEFSSDASGEVSKDAETLIAAPEPPEEPEEASEQAEEQTPAPETPVPTGEEGSLAAVETEGEADKTVTVVETAESAEQLTASDDAPEAENMLQYYNALLDSRLGDLFECKRLDVYMESEEDYVTVFKNSPGHRLILQAGAYDVSAKLLEDDLTISDDWLARKNPGAFIKIVDSSVLGSGISSSASARAAVEAMLQRPGWRDVEAGKTGLVIALSDSLLRSDYGRMAAAVYIAKAMYPSQFTDVDADDALRTLLKESSGSDPDGIYVYVNQ